MNCNLRRVCLNCCASGKLAFTRLVCLASTQEKLEWNPQYSRKIKSTSLKAKSNLQYRTTGRTSQLLVVLAISRPAGTPWQPTRHTRLVSNPSSPSKTETLSSKNLNNCTFSPSFLLYKVCSVWWFFCLGNWQSDETQSLVEEHRLVCYVCECGRNMSQN